MPNHNHRTQRVTRGSCCTECNPVYPVATVRFQTAIFRVQLLLDFAGALCQPWAVEMNEHLQEVSERGFRRGLALAWIPSIPLVLAILNSFHRMSEQKATGLGAIAGGLAEVYLPFVILLTLGVEVAAIVFLIRSFSRPHLGRTLVSVFSIAWSMLVIASFALLIWGLYIYVPHAQASH